jgi:hypothetical protein
MVKYNAYYAKYTYGQYGDLLEIYGKYGDLWQIPSGNLTVQFAIENGP